MKVAASSLLFGVAAAAVAPQQQPLQAAPEAVKQAFESATDKGSWSKSLKNLEHDLKHLTDDARAVWDEVAMMFPEDMSKASYFSLPKAHERKEDSEWDFRTSGKAIQDVWVTNSKGEQEREIDGNLEAFNLRTKKVDPAVLGVDKVKQYSGYLDDDEEDKHLFYCE